MSQIIRYQRQVFDTNEQQSALKVAVQMGCDNVVNKFLYYMSLLPVNYSFNRMSFLIDRLVEYDRC